MMPEVTASHLEVGSRWSPDTSGDVEVALGSACCPVIPRSPRDQVGGGVARSLVVARCEFCDRSGLAL